MKHILEYNQFTDTQPVLSREYEEYVKQYHKMVPVEQLLKFMSHDRSGHVEEIEKLKGEISEEGLEQPIILGYDYSKKKASIVEGNHRLLTFKELGYKEMPVRIHMGGIPSEYMGVTYTGEEIGHVEDGVSYQQLGLESRKILDSDFKG